MFTTIASPSPAATSARRSVPVAWSELVIATFAPKERHAAATRSSSVATITSRRLRAPRAPSKTRRTIGTPAIGASGLPGKRVAANRAGIRPTAFMAGIVPDGYISRRAGSPPQRLREQGRGAAAQRAARERRAGPREQGRGAAAQRAAGERSAGPREQSRDRGRLQQGRRRQDHARHEPRHLPARAARGPAGGGALPRRPA